MGCTGAANIALNTEDFPAIYLAASGWKQKCFRKLSAFQHSKCFIELVTEIRTYLFKANILTQLFRLFDVAFICFCKSHQLL
jgi:hypothetical protein